MRAATIGRTASTASATIGNLVRETAATRSRIGAVIVGRVTKIEPSLNAAFVEVGLERPGMLPLKKQGAQPTEGQALVVQVRRDARDEKAARLSATIHTETPYADRVAGAIHSGEIKLVGRTEAEVANDIGRRLIAEGHERVAFVIVASGPNSASPHHEPGERVIGRDDGRGDSQLPCDPADALRHVARARGPDTRPPFLRVRLADRARRAPQLEGADRLQALELEPDLAGCLDLEPDERARRDGIGRDRACPLDRVERDQNGTSVPTPRSARPQK